MKMNYKYLKAACYTTNISMSVVSNISALLFITFRTLYGISYSLLGLLVVINFTTQLGIDLIFSFFSHKFNIEKTVKFTPILTVIGLVVFSIWPSLFPNNIYIGLVIGTMIFAASGGLVEVLISPVIAAIPADDPDREMSKLHSVYAWGVVGVVIIATLFLYLFGIANWQWLTGAFAVVPLCAAFLFSRTDIPEMETPEKVTGAVEFLKNKGIWLCVAAIFFGGATECTMAQWSSGYLEKAIGIPKVLGDIFGVAMFGLTLGLGRSLYAKFGRKIEKVLLLCTIGATFCYFLAAVSPIPVIGLLACAVTGFCASMLWPGNLVVASGRFGGSVFIFALMAAGGDFGASVGPQLVGLLTDAVMVNGNAAILAQNLGITVEQLGMKAGMLAGMAFPVLGILVQAIVLKTSKKYEKNL